jgi:hypothetical protein
VPLDDNSSEADSMDTTELEMALKEWGEEEEDSRLPSAEELAAIHEASPIMSAVRRSKRRAIGVDEEVGATAERQKAMRNEGNLDQASLFNLVDDASVIANLKDVGIFLGSDDASSSSSLVSIKKNVVGCDQVVEPCSLKEKVLDQEEKDLLEEELEKLFFEKYLQQYHGGGYGHGE